MSVAQRWLEFAEIDLRMAELALAHEIFGQTCFHAHQCVEKALKGILAQRGEAIPRTHSLIDLGHRVADLPPELTKGLLFVEGYYFPTRYPDARPVLASPPGREAAERCFKIAEEVLAWAKKIVG
ncbi:HEPN domain-containing protein [Candidatus Bipolaricaulota bacterium]|nr:HEPN domain-containing protein [Candidatus Bipolaricaulota bacterium]